MGGEGDSVQVHALTLAGMCEEEGGGGLCAGACAHSGWHV